MGQHLNSLGKKNGKEDMGACGEICVSVSVSVSVNVNVNVSVSVSVGVRFVRV